MTTVRASDDTRCVTLRTIDDDERTWLIVLRGSVGRGALARLEAVLHAIEHAPHPLVVDLSAARTDDARLLRLLGRAICRRREAGWVARLHGVHAGVLPDPDHATLAEMFLVYESACNRP